MNAFVAPKISAHRGYFTHPYDVWHYQNLELPCRVKLTIEEGQEVVDRITKDYSLPPVRVFYMSQNYLRNVVKTDWQELQGLYFKSTEDEFCIGLARKLTPSYVLLHEIAHHWTLHFLGCKPPEEHCDEFWRRLDRLRTVYQTVLTEGKIPRKLGL